MDELKELEQILTKKINFLTTHPHDCNEKKLPGLVEALKDLHELTKK
jgi:hypothetical protein